VQIVCAKDTKWQCSKQSWPGAVAHTNLGANFRLNYLWAARGHWRHFVGLGGGENSHANKLTLVSALVKHAFVRARNQHSSMAAYTLATGGQCVCGVVCLQMY